ncbi:MAG TPA: c-type cytochrome [Bryobacteraceae bacterium]|jgi:cytochrome c553|nr:c-type cytochrome [Bryobacteraceae bacterium]
MNRKAVVLAIALLGLGSFVLTGQQPATSTVFTAAQADAGRTAFENSCGQCHTYSVRGRKGEEGELPPLASLPAPYQKFIGPRGRVPALMGAAFVQKYGQKKVTEMFTLFRGAADTTPVAELHMSDDTLVNITAYILQKNGAKPGNQPLEKTTGDLFGSVVE